LLFERLAASKDKDKVKALAEKGQIIQTSSDAIKDPYIFEFFGWPEH
jgi:predicted nuclease of restriction endonuclease-like (RecB) superfamily